MAFYVAKAPEVEEGIDPPSGWTGEKYPPEGTGPPANPDVDTPGEIVYEPGDPPIIPEVPDEDKQSPDPGEYEEGKYYIEVTIPDSVQAEVYKNGGPYPGAPVDVQVRIKKGNAAGNLENISSADAQKFKVIRLRGEIDHIDNPGADLYIGQGQDMSLDENVKSYLDYEVEELSGGAWGFNTRIYVDAEAAPKGKDPSEYDDGKDMYIYAETIDMIGSNNQKLSGSDKATILGKQD